MPIYYFLKIVSVGKVSSLFKFLIYHNFINLYFLFFFMTGEAIKCYECNSHNDSRCAMDIPPEALQKDCAEHTEGSKYTMCRKITQSIDFEVNGRK